MVSGYMESAFALRRRHRQDNLGKQFWNHFIPRNHPSSCPESLYPSMTLFQGSISLIRRPNLKVPAQDTETLPISKGLVPFWHLDLSLSILLGFVQLQIEYGRQDFLRCHYTRLSLWMITCSLGSASNLSIRIRPKPPPGLPLSSLLFRMSLVTHSDFILFSRSHCLLYPGNLAITSLNSCVPLQCFVTWSNGHTRHRRSSTPCLNALGTIPTHVDYVTKR